MKWALPFVAAILGFLAVVPRGFRSVLDSVTVFILAVIGYVSFGNQKDVCVGSLATFLENLVQGGLYGQIHIVSYSVGSMIALDALFPTVHPIRRFAGIDTLVTVGCAREGAVPERRGPCRGV